MLTEEDRAKSVVLRIKLLENKISNVESLIVENPENKKLKNLRVEFLSRVSVLKNLLDSFDKFSVEKFTNLKHINNDPTLDIRIYASLLADTVEHNVPDRFKNHDRPTTI